MDQTEKQTKETDVELLCKYIYDYGEQYMDGTAAIIFSKLKQVGLFLNYLKSVLVMDWVPETRVESGFGSAVEK